MARVPREPPQEPPSSSPLVPTGLQRHPGWRGIPLLRRLGSHVPPPLLFVALLPWLCPLSWQGHFSSSAPRRGCPPHSCSHPHRLVPVRPCPGACVPLPRSPCALLLLGSQSTCRWPGLALHISHCAFCQPSPLVSWVTTRTQTRRASHALGGLSAHLSPMCLSGRQQMCPLQRLLPQPLWSPILQHLGTDTFLILHPSGSVVGLGHPAPPHLHSGSKHGPGRSILKSQPQLVGQPCCLACVYLL